MHSFNPSTQEAETGGSLVFEASLVYSLSSRAARGGGEASGRASEVTRWEKGLATKPDDLSLIPRDAKKEPTPTDCPESSTHTVWHTHKLNTLANRCLKNTLR